MDKRTVLALFLVAIVVLITPKLFPGSNLKGTRPQIGHDSAATGSAAIAATAASLAPATSASSLSARASGAPPQVGDTTVIRSANAEFAFTEFGAVPARVSLPGYRALNGNKGHVSLTTGVGSLLSYRLLGSRDTLSLATMPFTVSHSATQTGILEFRGHASNREVSLLYRVIPDSFVMHVEGSVKTDNDGDPAEYLLIDLPSTLRSFEVDSLDDQRHLAFAVKPRIKGAEGIGFGKLSPGEKRLVPGPLSWAAVKNKYFIVGVLAREGDENFAEATTTGGTRTSSVPTTAFGAIVIRLTSGTFRFDVYAGPQKAERLQALGRDFENSNPYGGWLQGIVQPFATLVLKVLLWMRATLKLNYGWILIIFGVTVRFILWPLNHGAMRSSMKMQRIQPELNELQKRHKENPQKLQSEMMRVYKEHDMSPFSTFAGCLPLLLPMPVLFALFFVFGNTIEFRGVSFLWLTDISIKDPLYLIPLLMGVSMFVLSWVGMRNSPPNPQAKMMLYIFPVMMTVMFANLASGLNLYYAIQNIAAIPQQWLIAHERAKSSNARKI